VLWQRQLWKGHSRQQGGPSAARGDQVWLRYLVRGERLFCRGQSGGPLSRGDCPRRDSPSVVKANPRVQSVVEVNMYEQCHTERHGGGENCSYFRRKGSQIWVTIRIHRFSESDVMETSSDMQVRNRTKVKGQESAGHIK